MTPSSLIFVVIFAVWAAYMLQHWVRRREDLATARSVDRFSEAMRMLERRNPVKADVSSPADEPKPRILRPQVSVKSSGAGATAVDAEHEEAKGGRIAKLREGATAVGSAAGRAPRPSLSSPEVKAGLLLSALVFFVLTSVLAPFGVVPGWMPLLGLVAVGGVVVWLRRGAVAAQRSRTAAPRRTSVSAPKAREDGTSKIGASEADSGAVKVDTTAEAEAVVARSQEQTSTKAASTKRSPLVAEHVAHDDVVFDQEPDMASVAKAEAEVFDAGWAPVDVPRPTYTMKAKAERAEVAPAATTPAPDDSRPIAARYENTPVEDLPFDGMALDEDYDDLPQVYRAG